MISRLLLALALALAATTQASAQQTTWPPLGGRAGAPAYGFYTYPKAYLGQEAQPICQLTAAATVTSDAKFCARNPKAGIGVQAVTLTGASTLQVPARLPPTGGLNILYIITHSGTDGPTLGSGFQYSGGAQPPECNGSTVVTGCWSTTSGVVDWLPCVSIDALNIGCGAVLTNMTRVSPFVVGDHNAASACADGTTCAAASVNVVIGQNLLVASGYCNAAATCSGASSGITVSSITRVSGATIGTCVALTGAAGTEPTTTNTAIALHQCPVTSTGALVVQANFSAAVHAPTVGVVAVSGFAASPDDGIGSFTGSGVSASATVTTGTPSQTGEFFFNAVVSIGPTVFTAASGVVIDNVAPSGVDMLTQFTVPATALAQTMTATSSSNDFASAAAGLKHQ